LFLSISKVDSTIFIYGTYVYSFDNNEYLCSFDHGSSPSIYFVYQTIEFIWRSSIFDINIFQIIILIIDQHGIIQPYHEELTYIPNRDCNTKYNIYLLYPDCPKSLLNNYSIRISLYEKSKLNYRTSWFIEIPFQF
jgi:hypothetical protein